MIKNRKTVRIIRGLNLKIIQQHHSEKIRNIIAIYYQKAKNVVKCRKLNRQHTYGRKTNHEGMLGIF